MKVIDLRSDTLTQPTQEMRQAMFCAEVGDDGRTGGDGRGSDPTVNALEDFAAELVGKEAALFCASGTMGNVTALATHCARADKVAAEPDLHVVRSEKAPFMERFLGLVRQDYALLQPGVPDPVSFEEVCGSGVKLACVENSHNFGGGVCASLAQMKRLYGVAHAKGVLVHLDGARMFNAAVALGVDARDLAACADSVMFCLSKGLGAPFGSMLCGTRAFIAQARDTRRFLGGGLRQGGIMAAAGLVALRTGIERLAEDHEHARLLGQALSGFSTCELVPVQSNIVMLNIRGSGRSSGWFERELAPLGLLVKGMGGDYLRLTVYRGISAKDIRIASDIFGRFMEEQGLA